MIGLVTTALASAPHVDADPYRPTVDLGPFAAVDTATEVSTAVAAQSSWVTSPIRSVDDSGSVQSVIEHAWAWHFGVRQGFGPVKLGITAPVVPLRIANDAPEALALVGDPHLEALAAWDIGDFTVGGLGRLGLSLGAHERQLGYPGAFGDICAVGVWRGPVIVAANMGFRITPTLDLVDTTHDDAWWLRLGVALPIREPWTVSLEALGSLPRRGFSRDLTPVEGLVTSQHRLTDALTVNVGAGRGLSAGIGSPALRIIGGLRFAVGAPITRAE